MSLGGSSIAPVAKDGLVPCSMRYFICPGGAHHSLRGVLSIAVLCMPAAWGVRQGLIICHAIGMFAGLPTMYFMSFRTSASVDAGLKIVFNASSPCGVGGTFPPAAKRMTV